MTESDSFTPSEPESDSSTGRQELESETSDTMDEYDSPLAEAKDAAMSLEVRALDGAEYEAAPEESDTQTSPAQTGELPADEHGFSGADALIPLSTRFRQGEWQQEFSGHKIAAELVRIETDVRKILEERDPKRKRKFTGTERWHELEEDVIAMKFSGRMEEDALRELTRLVMQRHFLFSQLRYVASTRPTWNT